MPSLASQISIDIKIDNSGDNPKITLIDNTDYVNLDDGISGTVDASNYWNGVLEITQPDGISINVDTSVHTNGTFKNPDTHGDFGQGEIIETSKELRLDINGEIQKGTYNFVYRVKISNSITTVQIGNSAVITKTVDLAYDRPKITLNKDVNLFIPFVKVVDNTNYSSAGFTSSVARQFTGTINSVVGIIRTVTSTTSVLDYKYGNNYYDAIYSCVFSYVNTLVGSDALSWLTVKDKEELVLDNFDVYALTDINKLYAFLQSEQYIRFISGCKEQGIDLPTNKSIEDLIIFLDALYFKYVKSSREHTNSAINAYNFTGVNYNGTTITLSPNTTSYTAPYNLLLEKVVVYATTSTNFSVGNTVGADDVYAATFVNGVAVLSGDKVMNAGDIIYFNGVNSTVIIKLILKQL